MLTRRNLPRAIVSILLVSLLLLTSTGSSAAQGNDKTLYSRVGGYDKLATVVDDFIGRLINDKQFEKFFAGFSVDSKKRIRQHILDQFCAATGGPCVYLGRDMKTTHGGLGITEADWDAAVKHLTASSISLRSTKKRKVNCSLLSLRSRKTLSRSEGGEAAQSTIFEKAAKLSVIQEGRRETNGQGTERRTASGRQRHFR